MTTAWPELKPQLVGALTDAFTEGEFAQMLEFGCQQKLAQLVADRVPFPQKVYEVVGVAERYGWLDCLARAAQAANQTHAALQAVTIELLAGIVAHGSAFYQLSYSPTPPVEPAARKPTDIDAWVTALRVCATITSRDRRDDVVGDLPDYIQGNIERRSALYDDVYNITRTCMQYSGGLQALVAAIKKREGASVGVQRLEALL